MGDRFLCGRAREGLAPSRAHPQFQFSENLLIVHQCSEFIISCTRVSRGKGVRGGGGWPSPPRLAAQNISMAPTPPRPVLPNTLGIDRRRPDQPPAFAQAWLSACPRGTSCLKILSFETMYARRCACDLIVNTRRDTVGRTPDACLDAETHVGPGANRGEAPGV